MQVVERIDIEQTLRIGRRKSRMSSGISGNDGRVLVLDIGRHHAVEIQRPNSLIVADVSLGILRESVLPDVCFPKMSSLIKRKVI
jgi:hypothetical protein